MLSILWPQDKLLIGSVLPFNHLYFKFVVVNTESTAPTVKFWDGTEFRSVIDLVDNTDGFTSDGYIKWEVPESYSWYLEQYSYNVTGLSVTEIYKHVLGRNYLLSRLFSDNRS